MNRFAIPLVLFGLLVVVFGISLKRAPEKGVVPSALIGKPAPEFTLPDLLRPGEMVSSSTFKGSWVMVNVWGTWCAECYTEHPLLLDIAGEDKVKLIGLNYKDDDAAARKWLDELGNPYVAVAVDKQGTAAMDYGVYGAPETFLIDPQGVIVHKVVGIVTAAKWSDTLRPMIEGATP
jgi:cytochrome c biogenesis protein CcmG/thiol:disulfide interchange protein DsbE